MAKKIHEENNSNFIRAENIPKFNGTPKKKVIEEDESRMNEVGKMSETGQMREVEKDIVSNSQSDANAINKLNDFTNKLEVLFKDPERTKKTCISVYLDPATIKKIDAIAKKSKMSRTQVIATILDAYVDEISK